MGDKLLGIGQIEGIFAIDDIELHQLTDPFRRIYLLDPGRQGIDPGNVIDKRVALVFQIYALDLTAITL